MLGWDEEVVGGAPAGGAGFEFILGEIELVWGNHRNWGRGEGGLLELPVEVSSPNGVVAKPKPPKIPSRQIESRHDRVKVNEFSVATESVVAIQMDVSPRRRRDFCNYGQGFRILVCLVPGKQPRQDSGVVIDDGVRDQPRTLVADLDFDIGPAGEFFLATDLCDGGAELVVGL